MERSFRNLFGEKMEILHTKRQLLEKLQCQSGESETGMIERCKAYSSCLAGILSIVLPSDETIRSSPRNAFSSSIRLPANSMPAFNLSENSLFDIISYYFKSGFYNNCGHIIFATLSYLYGRECTVVIYFP